ncbi:hypothetical protein LCGC14_2422960, partial [marine sediment metagenome]
HVIDPVDLRRTGMLLNQSFMFAMASSGAKKAAR